MLFVKIGAIGDVIMAIPGALHYLQQNPNNQLVWIAGKTVAPLLRNLHPNLTIIEISESRLLTGNGIIKVLSLISLWKNLAFRKFNAIVIGHADWRYRLIGIFSYAPIRISFSHKKHKRIPVSGRHHIDEYARLFGVTDPNQLLQIRFPPSDAFREPLPAELQKNLPKKFIALAPGGAKNLLEDQFLRRYPVEHYASIAKKALKRKIPVVLVGAPSDSWVLPSFEGLKTINAIGQTNLRQTVELFARADTVITHDSGPMHLANLAEAKVLSFFGPTNPWEKAPMKRHAANPDVFNSQFIWGGEDLACRPCYDGKTYAKCTNNLCMHKIDVGEELLHTAQLDILSGEQFLIKESRKNN